jgi:hypothetical protein
MSVKRKICISIQQPMDTADVAMQVAQLFPYGVANFLF